MNILQKLCSEYYRANIIDRIFAGFFIRTHVTSVELRQTGTFEKRSTNLATVQRLAFIVDVSCSQCLMLLVQMSDEGWNVQQQKHIKIFLPDGEEAEGGRGHQRHPPRLEAAGSEGRLHPLLDLLGADDRHQLRLHLPAAVPPPRKASLTATSNIF